MDHPILQLLIGSSAPPKPIPPNASYALRYELWLRDNHKWLLPALDTARSLTLFLPGRFQAGGQLSSEGIYTALNVISLYHDYLLDQPRALTAEIKYDPQGSTAGWLKVCQGVLLLSHYTEVFMEMAAKKYFKSPAGEGEQSQGSWLCIAIIEAIKAYSRLCILYTNRGRMLTPPSQDEIILSHMSSIRAKQKVEILQRERNEYDQALKKEQLQRKEQQRLLPPPDIEMGGVGPASSSSTSLTPLAPDALPPNSSFSPSPLAPGHLPPVQIQNLLDLYTRHGRQTSTESRLGRPHGRFVVPVTHPHEDPNYKPPVEHVISEILNIIRPVVYTLARASYAQQVDSWIPFILSLSVDGASRALAPSMSSLSRSEMDEVSRRIRFYFLYLLRDPLFAKFTGPVLVRFSELLSRIPLIGVFLSSIIQLVSSIQKYYFYTSGS